MTLIVLEGLNGAGKSTLAKALALNLHGRYVATPHGDLAKFREAMDEASLSAHFLFYMLGNVLVSDEIRRSEPTEIVVCDRYVDSTIAGHAVLGLNVRNFDLRPFNLAEPDISLFIYCNEAERRERVERRKKKNKWDLLDESEVHRAEYAEYFRLRNRYLFVDTSGETEEESLEKIIAILATKTAREAAGAGN